MEFSGFSEQFIRECEHDACIFRAEYQSMSDEFRNDVSFDCYLNCVLVLKPGKRGVVNYIRRTMKEKAEHSIDERIEKEAEVLVCGLQPTNMEVGEDTITSEASTLPVEPSYEVHSSSTFDDIVCEVNSTHDVAYQFVEPIQEYESIYCSRDSEMGDSDQHGVIVQFVNNPLFEFDGGLVYDNPLFELETNHTPDTSPVLGNDHSVWDLSNALGFQTGLTEEFYSVYMVRSAYSFAFDPPVHDSYSMHNSCVHDDSLCAVKRSKSFLCSELLSSEGETRGCKFPTELFAGDYLQDQRLDFHHASVYLTEFATSGFHGGGSGSGHDGLVNHIPGSFRGTVERCCVVDASRYPYFILMDGCEYRLYWDPGGDRIGIVFWMGPSGLLHHFWHGEVEIRVAQRKSEGIRHGRLPFRVWDPGIFCATMFMLVLQESVRDVWDISQFFFWASRGLEFLCSGDCLRTSNFREGGLSCPHPSQHNW